MSPRNVLLALLAAVLLPASAAHADYAATVAATPGAASHWPLDEAQGAGRVADVLGARTSTVASGATLGRPGGIDFGGTSLSISGNGSWSAGNVNGFTGDLTLEAWVNPSTSSGTRYIVSKGTASSGYHLLLLNGARPTLRVNGSSIAGPALTVGRWHHVVATLSGPTATVYVNGAPAATRTVSAAPSSTSRSLLLGRYSNSGSGYFQGALDEIALYTGALDAAAVEAHFRAGADTTPPRTLMTGVPRAVSDRSDGTFAFTATKAGVTFTCSLDGRAETRCDGAYAYELLRDGTHTLVVTATDRWGIVEEQPVTYTWRVSLPANESAPPRTTLTAVPPALSNSATATFVLSGSKSRMTFACRLDGSAWGPCGPTLTLANLKEGDHTLEVRGTDRWGAVEEPVSYRWRIDLTPPETFVVATKPLAGDAGTAAIGSESGAVFECRTGDGEWARCEATHALPAITAATQLSFRAVDPAGNADASPATLDLVPPGAAAAVLFSGASRSFMVGGHRSASGLQCSVDGAPPAPCPWPLDLKGLAYGDHRLTVTDPALPGVEFPTLAWSNPLPAPLIAGSQFPAVVSLGSPTAQARVAKARLPRLLFQSNAPGRASLRLLHGKRQVLRWGATVVQGSNLVVLPARAWKRLRPGRYGLQVMVRNAGGSSKPLRLRFDALRARR